MSLKLDNISKYVQESLDENGWEECFLVEVVHGSSNKIDVYLDSDDGISFAVCRKVSRYIEEKIDESKEYGEKYILNVSSAGIGRPLKMQRQYFKNIGRKVVVKTAEEESKGILKEATEEFIMIEMTKGKKNTKKYTITEKKIEMKNILETKIAVSF